MFIMSSRILIIISAILFFVVHQFSSSPFEVDAATSKNTPVKSSSTAAVLKAVHGTEFGPVPESTCTTFLNAYWCPTSLMCVVAINSSAAAFDHCNEVCDATCIDFTHCQTCASDERNCGDCMFAGGVWSLTRNKCFPDAALCSHNNDTCVEDDRLCPVCDRYNRPASCLPLFPLAVAVLSGALLFAIAGSVWILLHWYAPVSEEEVNAKTRLPHSEQPKQTANSARVSHRVVPAGEIVAVQDENGDTQYLVPVTAGGPVPPNASARLIPASAIVPSPNATGNRWSAVRTAVILAGNGTRLSGSPNHHHHNSNNNSGNPSPLPGSPTKQHPSPILFAAKLQQQQQNQNHQDDDALQGESLASNHNNNNKGNPSMRLNSNDLALGSGGNASNNLSSSSNNNSPQNINSSSKTKKPKRRESNTVGDDQQQPQQQ